MKQKSCGGRYMHFILYYIEIKHTIKYLAYSSIHLPTYITHILATYATLHLVSDLAILSVATWCLMKLVLPLRSPGKCPIFLTQYVRKSISWPCSPTLPLAIDSGSFSMVRSKWERKCNWFTLPEEHLKTQCQTTLTQFPCEECMCCLRL